MPEAKVSEYSDKFCLRGTRQGCPLLFALPSKPLAIAIRSSSEVRGFRGGIVEEKVALYADDLLLFLGDIQTSLLRVMEIIKNGQFSRLTISALLPVDPLESLLLDEVPQMEIVDKVKYLGINIMRDPKQYIINIASLPVKFKGKLKYGITSHYL